MGLNLSTTKATELRSDLPHLRLTQSPLPRERVCQAWRPALPRHLSYSRVLPCEPIHFVTHDLLQRWGGHPRPAMLPRAPNHGGSAQRAQAVAVKGEQAALWADHLGITVTRPPNA
jgi:hypothetical protein